jgi:hypothetical protein
MFINRCKSDLESHAVRLKAVLLALLCSWTLLAWPTTAAAQTPGKAISAADQFFLAPIPASIGLPNTDTRGLSPRSLAIDPSMRTLVLITMGQSLMANANANTATPVYVPANAAAVDNFNIYDGAAYPFSARPALGCNGDHSNVAPRIADMLINNGKFDRVIVVPIAIGSTIIADWATGNYAGRFPVAMKRLAAAGITPSMPGVTFAAVWGQGESDTGKGTSQASYAENLRTIVGTIFATGFTGRLFVNIETYNAGTVSPGVQAAQASVVNGTNVFQGGNWDMLGSSYRNPDDTHPNDAGAPLFASLIYDSMHASGAPF